MITDFHRTGKTDFWRTQIKPDTHRNQEKGAVSLQETDSDLPVSQCPGVSGGGMSLAPDQKRGREHSPTHQQKIGLKIY